MRVDFDMDDGEEQVLAGYLQGMAIEVSTKRYLDSSMQYIYRTLADQFGVAMDALARLNQNEYHHVYEWGPNWESRYKRTGYPGYRLWDLISTGSGSQKSVSFTFRPSFVPTPVHPLLLVPGKKSGKTVREGVHVFTWKASVMEFGEEVTVRPEFGEWLAFASEGKGKAMFTKQNYTFTPGYKVQGNFTSFFLHWWNAGPAQAAFELTLKPELESDLANEKGLHAAVASRRRTATFRIGGSDIAAFNQGKRRAQQDYRRQESQYLNRAAERRYDMYDDE